MNRTSRSTTRAMLAGLVGMACLLSVCLTQAEVRPEVMNVSTLYSQAITPVNAVHPLWTPVQHYRGMTFVVCPDLKLRPKVTQIDRAGVVATVLLDAGADPVYTASTDGHNRFTLGIDKNGYIHIIGDMHGYAPWAGTYIDRYQYQSILYWKSNKALDVRGGFSFCGGLNSTTRLPGVEWGGDSRFFNDRNGELYYSSRVRAFKGSSLGGSEPFIAYGVYKYNTTNGVWTALGGTVDPAAAPGAKEFNVVLYWEYTWGFEAYQSVPRFDNNNRLHFSIAGNTAKTAGSGLIYAYSDDCGITWKKANGAAIPGLPLRGRNGEANQGGLIIRSNTVAQQSSVFADKHGKLNVSGWTWNGSAWVGATGGYGILGPDSMLTAEGGSVLRRTTAIGRPFASYDTGFGQVFSTCELGLQNENAIYGIGLPPGFMFPTATNMSVYKATFRPNENVATGGVASANSGDANMAFDGANNVKWCAPGGSTGWLQYNFGGGIKRVVGRYNLISGEDMPGRDPKDWQFQGSNNGTNWVALDTRTGEVFVARMQTKPYSIANNTAYQYYRLNITANNGGGEIQLGEMELIGKWIPKAPTLFRPVTGNAKVWLSWSASACATSYNVKRATVSGGPYTTIATGVTNTGEYADAGLANGVTYCYVVSAVGSLGESSNSTQVSAKPVNQPLAPIIQSAVGGNQRIVLNWIPLWPVATSYNVKRATVSGGPYTTIATRVTGLSYTNTGLINDTNYYYAVSASGLNGVESPDSAQISGTPFRWIPILKYGSVGYDPSIQGKASASSENPPGETAASAFDGFNSKWLAMTNVCWLQYRFSNGVKWAATRYTLVSGGDGPERDPKDWQLLGSDDGANWTTLDTRTGQTFTGRNVTSTYTFSNRTAYQYYRLNITANMGNGITQLAELALWADGVILLKPETREENERNQ